jgi:hypothetical protein
MRTLVLHFPRLGIQLLREARADLFEKPLALVNGEADAALLSTVSCEATRDGVEPGMTPAQARQRCPGLAFEPDNARQCLERLEAIASILKTRSTTSVAIVSRNALAVSLAGMQSQFADEGAAANALLAVAKGWSGLDVRAAVGPTVAEATNAARTARRFAVILPGEPTNERLPRYDPLAAQHTFETPAGSGLARAKLHRMAAALQALSPEDSRSYRLVTLEVVRGAYRTRYHARPHQPLHRASEALELVLGKANDGDLEGATALRLELSAAGPAVTVEPWRSASASVHQLSAPAVPIQRRLRLAS